MKNNLKEYDRPIQIAEGIYWVGFYDESTNLHCNPYLIVGNELPHKRREQDFRDAS